MKFLELKVPPAVVFFLCVGLIWTIDYLFPPMFVLSLSSWIFWALLVIGALTSVIGLIQFAVRSTSVNPHKPDHVSSLVTSGVYRLSRNPMYLGMLIILFAAALKFGHPIGLIILPLYVLYMNRFQIEPEEKAMEKKFGEKFRKYRQDVRRWV